MYPCAVGDAAVSDKGPRWFRILDTFKETPLRHTFRISRHQNTKHSEPNVLTTVFLRRRLHIAIDLGLQFAAALRGNHLTALDPIRRAYQLFALT